MLHFVKKHHSHCCQLKTKSCKKYTLAGNWDGIHDNETGILMYTWTVGTTVCGTDVVQYNDPHEHLASASQWTNIGVAFPLKLPGNH